MAKDRQEEHLDQQAQQRSLKERKALSDVYSALEAEKVTNAFAAFTFEEALQNQLDKYTTTVGTLRPSELERVDNMLNKLLKAVEELKAEKDENFRDKDESNDVNTPA